MNKQTKEPNRLKSVSLIGQMMLASFVDEKFLAGIRELIQKAKS